MIIANCGSKAVITDFLGAALNPSLMARYSHVVVALLIMGAFAAMAVSAWYLIKGRHADFAMKTMRIGAVVGIVTSCVMIFTAHASAVVVAEEQPTKLAMMEGMYDDEVPPLYLFGWVDEESQQVITPFSIPGGTSFLATGTWDTEYQGLNSLAETEQYGALDPETAPVNFVFQTYHIMVAMYGLIMITAILAIVFTYRKGGRIKNMKWLQRLVLISPVFPVIAIQTGWFTAELGRQPWVVYPSATGPEGVALATGDAASASVSAPELLITMALFFLVYVFLIFAWARVMGRFIKEGPVVAPAEADDAASDEAKRKDPAERATLMNQADLVFLCLPDAAAREAVTLIDNPATRVIDASTAHRTAPGWVYGFAELKAGQRAAIAGAKRVANPSTCPAGVQFTKSLLVESGTPGKKVKDEFTR